jgi:preprotein translocase subunit YajC
MRETLIQYLAQQSAAPAPVTGSNGISAPGLIDSFGPFIMMIVIFGMMWLLMIRPQRREEKRKKEMLAALKKGDSVITSAGIIGTVANIKDDSVLLNIGDGVRVEFLRSAISVVRDGSKQETKEVAPESGKKERKKTSK